MSAVISHDGMYRYLLERDLFPNNKTLGVIMINPSTADAEVDDPTIRRLMGFCARGNFGKLIVGNLFAYRSTEVKVLKRVNDPLGPDNNKHLNVLFERIKKSGGVLLAGWGNISKYPEGIPSRVQDVTCMAQMAGLAIHCLGTNKDGSPKHPLFVPYSVEPTIWKQ